MTDIVTIDMETYYDDQFSLSKMTTESYIRDPRFEAIMVGIKVNNEKPYLAVGEDIVHALRDLKLENKQMLAHNMAFDGAIVEWLYNIHPKFLLDTLSMSRPVTGATAGGSLKKLAEYFKLGQKGTEVVNAKGKRLRDFTADELDAYGTYCVNDVELTYELFKKLMPYSTKQEMFIIDMLLRMYTQPVIEIDRDLMLSHLGEVRDRKAKLLAKVEEILGKDELMSNDKLAVVLRKLGVEPPMKTSLKTGKQAYAFAKNDEEFKALLEHPDYRVQAVVGTRLGVKSTLEETRTESMIKISERGSLPIMLNYYGAHTGRASGGDKMNLQNLPRGGALRKALRAPKGHKLIVADSAQIEARVVAWLAGETELVNDFANGEDIYSKFASIVYDRPINRKRKAIHPETGKEYYPDFNEGFVGKTCILGLGYGMGAAKFAAQLKPGGVVLDEAEAQRIVKLYRYKYRQIVKLWGAADTALDRMARGMEGVIENDVMSMNCARGRIRLPNGMDITYNGLRADQESGNYVYSTRYGDKVIYGAKVIENVVQALARIVVFNQMAKIKQLLSKRDGTDGIHKVVLTVHDEIVCVVPDAWADQTLGEVLEIMKSVPSWAKGLPISCEGDIAENYGDAK